MGCSCEAKKIKKFERMAAKMAYEMLDLRRLGDGNGGYVLETIKLQFKKAEFDAQQEYCK